MDSLDNLPIDENSPITPQEVQVVDQYFGGKKKPKKMWSEVKEVLIATVLFLVMSNPYFDILLDKLPHTESPLIRMGLKGLIYAVTLFVAIVMLC